MEIVEDSDPEALSGIMYITDPKNVEHCVFYTRKVA